MVILSLLTTKEKIKGNELAYSAEEKLFAWLLDLIYKGLFQSGVFRYVGITISQQHAQIKVWSQGRQLKKKNTHFEFRNLVFAILKMVVLLMVKNNVYHYSFLIYWGSISYKLKWIFCLVAEISEPYFKKLDLLSFWILSSGFSSDLCLEKLSSFSTQKQIYALAIQISIHHFICILLKDDTHWIHIPSISSHAFK